MTQVTTQATSDRIPAQVDDISVEWLNAVLGDEFGTIESMERADVSWRGPRTWPQLTFRPITAPRCDGSSWLRRLTVRFRPRCCRTPQPNMKTISVV